MPGLRAGLWALGVVAGSLPGSAMAAERWVDTTLPADCGDYDPATRACGGGDQPGYATLAAADAAAMPGDVVNLRAGIFNSPFVVTASGSAGMPVVFRGYADEEVVFTGIDSADGAILVEGRQWVGFERLIIKDVGSWVRVVDSQHVAVRGSQLSNATIEGTRGSIKLLRSDDCLVEGNTIVDGNDNITIVDALRSRVLNNQIAGGRHSLISVRCSSGGVFRGNILRNEIQKAVEVYDCEGSSSDDPEIYNATKRNLWEGNAFAGTAASDQSHDFNAMQLAGQDGIVRRNIYFLNLGGGVNLQVYPEEALENHGNRIYHNTLVANLCYALASGGASPAYYDNVVAANLLYGNADCAGGGEQIAPGDPSAALFVDNTLATRDPGFVDPEMADFRLVDGSPVIDTGPWLTAAVGDGRGTTLVVADARWFYDGGGIAGEQGDVVQLAGDTATARVVAVDLAAGTLMLDAPLAWVDGQGVALAYVGAAPDPGAFEAGLEGGESTGGESGDSGESGGDESSGGEVGETTGGGETAGDDGGVPTSGVGETSAAGVTTGGGTGGSSGAPEDGGGGGCGCSTGGGAGGVWLLLGLGLRRRRGRGVAIVATR